jgi:hypothetical protein
MFRAESNVNSFPPFVPVSESKTSVEETDSSIERIDCQPRDMSFRDEASATCIDRESKRYKTAKFIGGELYVMVVQSFIFGTSVIPLEGYGKWAAAAVVSGYVTPALCDGVDALVSKNQDIRVILRAQHEENNGNALVGFAKLVGKHLGAPLLPVALVAYAIAGPEKDLGHKFIHGLVHSSIGYSLYRFCSILAEQQWPAADPNVQPAPLSVRAQRVQDYIGAPVLSVFPRMLLMAEFLRSTELDVFIQMETHGLHAPVVFGMLHFLSHCWRALTAEHRAVQDSVTLPESTADFNIQENNDLVAEGADVAITVSPVVTASYTHNSEQHEDTLEDKRCSSSTPGQVVWTGLKSLMIYGGGILGNSLHTQIVGKAYDDDLLERTQRYASVAMGMGVIAGAFDGAEKLWKNRSSFFGARTVNLSGGNEPLLQSSAQRPSSSIQQ